ncbi:MAG: ornithine carbamoyltransferase [Spirochaetes bacterium]|nr:ornithine carbamoyltransferase [Spirochaetota bacterium]
MKIKKLKSAHLLKDSDLSRDEIISVFELTAKLKKAVKSGKKHALLNGRTLGMIFEKSSTRTRVSFETGMYQLGGHALFLSKNDIQIGRGETIADTSRVLSRYLDGIMIRTFEQNKINELAEYSSIPVINGLTDDYHPCQALTDYFTIFERVKTLKNVKLAFIGDGNNMVNSLLLTGAILGIDVSVACPAAYTVKPEILEEVMKAASSSGSKITVTDDINLAAYKADYIYTDVWASMGQEEEMNERKKHFESYRISKKLLSDNCPDALVMHCLPAHRGEEIDADVLESENSIVFDEAENRLHTQKAIMAMLMK